MKLSADERRIFLAVPAPAETRHLLKELSEKNSFLEKIKWMRPQNIHLTLYFIGNIPAEHFQEIVTTILSLTCTLKKFTLQFDVLCFAPSGKPRMIWAQYKKHNSFSAFARSIHLALQPLISSGKFYFPDPVPHLTLARFHSVKNYFDIVFPENVSLPEIPVNSCELWETISVKGRSDYRSITTFPLS